MSTVGDVEAVFLARLTKAIEHEMAKFYGSPMGVMVIAVPFTSNCQSRFVSNVDEELAKPILTDILKRFDAAPTTTLPGKFN